ncbi:MAG: hypothetical protein RR623_06590 [Bacilli bacterium]
MKKSKNFELKPKFEIGETVYIKEIEKIAKILDFRDTGYYFYQYVLSLDNTKLLFMEDKITKINNEIHITSNGVDTFAVLKDNGKVIKRAKAKCLPQDTYNLETGATIVFNRLFNKKHEEKKEVKEKEWNARVVCISSNVFCDIGRIFTIENGCLYASCNSRTFNKFKNIDELNNFYSKEFIELAK